MRDTLFRWLPPKMRDQQMEAIKGYVAVSFAATLSRKHGLDPRWIIARPLDSAGIVVKVAEPKVANAFMAKISALGYEFESEVI